MLRNANNGPRHSREKTRQIVARVYKYNITIIFSWQDKLHCLTVKPVKQTVFSFKKLISCLSVWAFRNATTKFFKSVRARYKARSFSSSCTSAQWFHMAKSRQNYIHFSFSVWFHEFFKVTFRISVSGQWMKLHFCQTVADIWVWSINFPDFFNLISGGFLQFGPTVQRPVPLPGWQEVQVSAFFFALPSHSGPKRIEPVLQVQNYF